MPRKKFPPTLLFNAKGATGVCDPIRVEDYQHIVIAVSAALNSSLTFKFQCSAMDDVPDFASAQAVNNMWDYVAAYDFQEGATIITGDTGVTLNNDTVANNTRLYLINTDHITWFSLQISAYTDGALTAYLIAAND